MQTGKPKRLLKGDCVLVAIDFQERIVPVMREGASAVAEAAKLIKGFRAQGCPVLVTQQYTKGLGDSVVEIKEALEPFSHIEKSSFSAMADPVFADVLKKLGRRTVVLCGIESHVCVLQTALDMVEAGYDVFCAFDAVSSRKERDETAAKKRMIASGVVPTTAESALFELLGNDSKSETFKAISRLVK